MLRKLLLMPSRPAIIIVNTMELFPPSRGGHLAFEGNKPFVDGYSEGTAQPSDLTFEFPSYAEDSIAQLAAYYAVPTVSLRNALFRELKANSSLFPLKRVFHDRHHPGAWGHSLMAQMVVDRLRAAVLEELHSAASAYPDLRLPRPLDDDPNASPVPLFPLSPSAPLPSCDLALSEPLELGAPIISTSAEAEVGMCVKDRELMSHVIRAKGFGYVVEGSDAKMKPGLLGRRAGDMAQLCVDISRLRSRKGFVVIVGHLISYEHMGIAQLSCTSGCECESVQIDAHVPDGRFSVFKAKTISVVRSAMPLAGEVANCSCVLELAILNHTNSGEHKFKVLSLMTAKEEGSLRYGHQTGFNVRPTEARLLDDYKASKVGQRHH